ncbi:hypothetical protein U8P77_35385 (plasmid) [Rhizobium johnstonii]|nr:MULTISPECIES: hypothetical protein [Rhizobium]WSH48970.1 hypothetical protein U8P77_35385 [Rhizobium johnstonii]
MHYRSTCLNVHARPLLHMDASKEHQGLAFIACEPGVWGPAALFLAGWIGFRETGHRDKAAMLDAEPTLPMRKIQSADIRGAAIHLITQQGLDVDLLTLGPQFFGLLS